MREALRDPHRIRHMIDAIVRVNKFMDGKTEIHLSDDKILFYAVVKNIEILGEAAYKLTAEFKNAHTQTPWRDIIGMRHILVHGYYQISAHEIFNVWKNNLSSLLEQLETYLIEFDDKR